MKAPCEVRIAMRRDGETAKDTGDDYASSATAEGLFSRRAVASLPSPAGGGTGEKATVAVPHRLQQCDGCATGASSAAARRLRRWSSKAPSANGIALARCPSHPTRADRIWRRMVRAVRSTCELDASHYHHSLRSTSALSLAAIFRL